jgi:DNA-binding NtrC family response regulator
MKARLLIAEDDADLRDLLQDDLEAAGYEIAVAVDGCAALAQLEFGREQFDLLITDVRMPGLSGDQLLRQVHRQWPEMPVIVTTAFGTVEHAAELVTAGAFQYLPKPFETDELLRTVEAALCCLANLTQTAEPNSVSQYGAIVSRCRAV